MELQERGVMVTDRELLESIASKVGILTGEFKLFKEQAEKRFDRLEEDLKSFRAEVNDRFTKLEARLAALETKTERMQEQINSLQGQIIYLQEQIDTLSKFDHDHYMELNELKDNQSAIFEIIGEYRVQVVKLRRRMLEELRKAS